MRSLLNARRYADEFDAVVDGRRPLEETRPELATLAGVAIAFREHSPVDPRPEFTASLRERLMAEAELVLSSEAPDLALPVSRPGSQQRRLVAAAAAAVLVGGSAGVAAAAQSALPGDALYPLKRGIERAEAGLNTDAAAKGQDLLRQAEGRLHEAEQLLAAGDGSTAQLPRTVEDFSVQADQGAGLLLSSFQETRDPEHVESVRSFTAAGTQVLQDLARTAPPLGQEALAEAAVVLQDIDERALQLCSACSDRPALRMPELLLSALQPASDPELPAVSAREIPDNSHPLLRSDSGGSSDGAQQQSDAGAEPGSGSSSGSTGQDSQADVSVKDVKKSLDDAVTKLNESLDPVTSLVPPLDSTVDGVTDDGLSEDLLP